MSARTSSHLLDSRRTTRSWRGVRAYGHWMVMRDSVEDKRRGDSSDSSDSESDGGGRCGRDESDATDVSPVTPFGDHFADGGGPEDGPKTEDARLFDLIAENYRDFFSLAQSLDTSAEAGLRAHERRGLEDELKRRRADRRDRLEAPPTASKRLLAELEADLGAADVAVERCAHASLALRAQLDGAVDFVRDGALVGRLRRRAAAGAPQRRGSAVEAAFVATCVRDAGAADDARRRVPAPAAPWASARGSRPSSLSAPGGRPRDDLPGDARVRRRARGPALAAAEAAAGARAEPKTAGGRAIADWRRGAGAADRSLHGVDLVCHGVWAPVCAALGGLDGVFDLGTRRRRTDARWRPRFADDLAALAASGDRALARRVRRRLKAHPATATLEERWNLPVYFELVRGDLVRDLDDALAATYVLVDGPRRGRRRCRTASRARSASSLDVRRVVLAPAGDKFAGLAFELVGLLAFDSTRSTPPRPIGAGFEASLDLDLATADAVAAGARAALAPGRRLRAAAAERLEAALASRRSTARGQGRARDVPPHGQAAARSPDADAFAAGSGLDAAATFPRAKAAIAAVLAPN
ncbi:hypothetical protein JL722_13564 [Aureococcus anophagefferens]|nr:hypothetical protein JL722_13564 [Aureococcus anophagefferens]